MNQVNAFTPPISQEFLDGEVHVWSFDLDVDSEREAALERTLEDKERQRAARFRFLKHRRRFVVGRGTLREIIAWYEGIEPQALRFKHGVHGKPRLDWLGSACGLVFNSSDSHGVGALAISRGTELGLDLELVRPSRDYELIASRQFAPEEKEWLCGLPESKRLLAFFELWTCKEAYLKGKGLGLTVPLDSFAINLCLGKPPQLAWSTIDDTDPDRWSIHRLEIAPSLAASLAVEGSPCSVRQACWPPSRASEPLLPGND